MHKIRSFFGRLATGMRRAPQNSQGRAFVRVLQFFAVMLALTIFARGASAATMPVVETAQLTSQTIRVADSYPGNVSASGKVDIELPVGLTVEKIHVTPGSRVEVGDTLLTFDTTEMDALLADQRLALQDLQLQLTELQRKQEQDDTGLKGAREAQEAAQRALADTQAAGADAVAAAQKAVDNAAAALERAKGDVADAETKLAAERAKPEGPEKEAAVQAAEAGLKAARDAVPAAEALLGDAQDALVVANTQAARANEDAQRTLDSANTALADAQEDYNETTPVFNMEQQKRQTEMDKLRLDITKQQGVVAQTETLAQSEGVLTAETAGTVTEVTVEAHVVTAEGAYLRLSTGGEGYFVEFSVPQDKARGLKMGGAVNVELEQYMWGVEGRITGRGTPGETGEVPVRAQITGSDWAEGDSVKVTVIHSDKQYWTCLPLSAVRPADGGWYVLVLSEEHSVLGTQLVAKKVEVTVLDKDEKYAAVDGLPENSVTAVAKSSKPVADGDSVRIQEADTK